MPKETQMQATHSELGTMLFYAVEKLGGELRISFDETKRRQGERQQVMIEFDKQTNEIVLTNEPMKD